MRKSTLFFLLLIILTFSSMSLTGQASASRIDSTVSYSFNTPTDSVRSSITLIHRKDSIHLYEDTWVGGWNADSAKWLPSYKYYREYDQAGNEIIYTWKQWKDDPGWEPSDSVRNGFDSAGNQILRESYKWDPGQPVWTGERRDEYFPDGEGNDTLQRVSVWDGTTNDWQYSSQSRIIFDQESRILESLSYNWNTTESEWELSEWRRNEYLLNGSNLVEAKNGYLFDMVDSIWVHSSYVDYTYDSQDRVITEELYILDGGEVSMKVLMEYAFDASGNKTLHSGMTWIYLADTLVSGNREVYAFDDGGRETFKEILDWDTDLEDWLLQGRIITTYNEVGLISSQESTDYQYPDDKFTQSRTEYLYTPSGRDSVRILYIKYTYEQSLHLRSKIFFYPTAYYFAAYDTICAGQVYAWEGQEFGAGGTYESVYVSESGSDSIYTLHLTENPAPASFLVNGPTEVVLNQETLYIAEENEEVEYNWAVENGTILSVTENDTLMVRWESPGSGEVASWAINEYRCSSDTMSLQISIGSTRFEEPDKVQLMLYPIPVRDFLVFESEAPLGRIDLLDLNGRLVLSREQPETGVDLSSLENGIYVVRLRDAEGRILGTRRILKE